jgi:hypothetical protein
MRAFVTLALTALFVVASSEPAPAQTTVGTFRWQLAPYGSQVVLTVTQSNGLFEVKGVETQCGGNATLPVTGMAVIQANGLVLIGFTTVNERGRGLHTTAFINTNDFSGTWSDNANNINQPFVFNPGNTCPGGPRTDPTQP